MDEEEDALKDGFMSEDLLDDDLFDDGLEDELTHTIKEDDDEDEDFIDSIEKYG